MVPTPSRLSRTLKEATKQMTSAARSAAEVANAAPRPVLDAVIGENEPNAPAPRVVVIGGGITGLTAAWRVMRRARGESDSRRFRVRRHGTDSVAAIDVVVLESSDRVGGKISPMDVGTLTIDGGAESLLAMRREAVDLAIELGLSDALVSPATSSALLWSRGKLRDLPAGLVTGVPTDLTALADSNIISYRGLMRIPLDYSLGPADVHPDVAVGKLLRARIGDEVVDRLVEPILSGVYAGQADRLSMEMAMPGLFREVARHRSVLDAAASIRAGGAGGRQGSANSGRGQAPGEYPGTALKSGSVFAGIRGGLHRLPQEIGNQLRSAGAHVHTNAVVESVSRDDTGFLVTYRVGDSTVRLAADAVVMATPAPVTASLLDGLGQAGAAASMRSVETASVALVALAVPRKRGSALPMGSGFLVPPVEKFRMKAATFSSQKWLWLDQAARVNPTTGGNTIIRCSFGRHQESWINDRSDEDLVRLAGKELRTILGFDIAPEQWAVQRWPDALPQYAPGHRKLVSGVRHAVESSAGLELCGAAYDGVGIPACIASAGRAADRVIDYLTVARQ